MNEEVIFYVKDCFRGSSYKEIILQNNQTNFLRLVTDTEKSQI